MPPKKDAKKQPVVQQPVVEEPVIPPHELQGEGRFDYPGGANYIGQWRLVNGVKTKHGKGVLTIPGQGFKQIGGEKYDGDWLEDRMQGKGVYSYADGSVFEGDFKNNKHHGQGKFIFANGTVYQGEWEDGLMHGTGFYIDSNGRNWNGQFRNGKFETKLQEELGKQRKIQLKKDAVKRAIANTLNSMGQALAKSDKKTLKDNMAPFIVAGDAMKEFVKEPYSKVDERPVEKWTELVNNLKNGKVKVLNEASESEILGAERVLGDQLKDVGQVVEIVYSKDQKNTKAAFATADGNAWNVVLVQDEQKKK